MTDDEVRALYEDLRAVLETKLHDFDGAAACAFEAGEWEGAIMFALVNAADERVPVPEELIVRAAPVMQCRDSYDYAARTLRALVAAASE